MRQSFGCSFGSARNFGGFGSAFLNLSLADVGFAAKEFLFSRQRICRTPDPFGFGISRMGRLPILAIWFLVHYVDVFWAAVQNWEAHLDSHYRIHHELV